jgi:ADP-ribosylglycohydrolase
MFYALHTRLALEKCADSSRTTHASQQAVDACSYYGMVVLGALLGQPKEILLLPPSKWEFMDFDMIELLTSLDPKIEEVANGSFKHKQPPSIQGSGFVVRGMEAALWAFYHSTSFREGALLAANLGDDADTTTAIYGQLAGAYYGEVGIPSKWRAKLALVNVITSFADRLFDLAQRI